MTLTPVAELVRRGDPDRFNAALFAPPEPRERLFALAAFNLEIARIAPLVSEPMLGEIRLQWWRDTLEMIYEERRVRAHDVVRALAQSIEDAALPRARLDAVINARARDLDPDFPESRTALDRYLRDTGGALAGLGAAALTSDLSDAADAVAMRAGRAIAAAAWLCAAPELSARGARPLPPPGDGAPIDWAAIGRGDPCDAFRRSAREIALEAQTALARARAERSALPAACAPALLHGWRADRILAEVGRDGLDPRREPGAVSGFGGGLLRLWRGARDRW